MAKQLDTYGSASQNHRGYTIPRQTDTVQYGGEIHLSWRYVWIFKEENSHVAIANRMFEMCLLNMFMAKEAITSEVFSRGESDWFQFIRNNMLDMKLVLKKFVEYFNEILQRKGWKLYRKIRT